MAFLRLQVNVRVVSLNDLDFISSPLHFALHNSFPILYQAEEQLHLIQDYVVTSKSAVTAFCSICSIALIPGIV
jgi:hypothetical protein